MAPINESNPPENRDTAVMSSKHLLCSYLMDGIDTVLTKLQFQKSPVKNDSILLISSLCCKNDSYSGIQISTSNSRDHPSTE